MGLLLSAPTPVGCQGLASKFVSGDDENAVRLGVGDVDDAKVASCARLSHCHARAVLAGTIFTRPVEHFLDLHFRDAVPVHVRRVGLGIEVEAKVHCEKGNMGFPVLRL